MQDSKNLLTFLVGTSFLVAALAGCGPQTAWQRVASQSRDDLRSVASLSEDFAIAVGLSDDVRWNGEEWELDEESDVLAVKAIRTGGGQVWGVGAYDTYRFEGDRWIPIELPTTLEMRDILPLTDGTAIGVGWESDLWSWNGSGWKEVPAPEFGIGGFIWGESADEYWVAESNVSGTVERVFWIKDGASTEVTPEGIGNSVSWIGLKGAEGVPWLFGSLGGGIISHIFQWDGSGWKPVDTGDQPLRDLQPLDAETAFAVGEDGYIARLTSEGVIESVPAEEGLPRLNAIGGSSPTDLWAVGESGAILRFDPEFEVSQ